MKKWAVIDTDGAVVHGFDASDGYVMDYRDNVVYRQDRETPEWYHAGVQFVDVSAQDPRPFAGWYVNAQGEFRDGSPSLSASATAIPGDGTTPVTITFRQKGPRAPRDVVFLVNDEPSDPIPVLDGIAELDLMSSTPGDTITVEVQGHPLIEAVQVRVTGV